MARVVVAHRDGQMRETLVELLTELGHQVVGVSNGDGAWDLLTMATSSTVAVLDVAMPGSPHAFDLLHTVVTDPQVAARHGVIVLTTEPLMYTRLLPDDELSDLPADIVVLAMPFDLDDLERAVESVTEKFMTEARR